MSAKHTQGDWVEHNGDILAGGFVIAWVHGPNRADLIAERNANRALIAAAPKLLDALEAVLKWSGSDDSIAGPEIAARGYARAIIAKAKGEA